MTCEIDRWKKLNKQQAVYDLLCEWIIELWNSKWTDGVRGEAQGNAGVAESKRPIKEGFSAIKSQNTAWEIKPPGWDDDDRWRGVNMKEINQSRLQKKRREEERGDKHHSEDPDALYRQEIEKERWKEMTLQMILLAHSRKKRGWTEEKLGRGEEEVEVRRKLLLLQVEWRRVLFLVKTVGCSSSFFLLVSTLSNGQGY